MSIPKIQKEWRVVQGHPGFESLKLNTQAPVPTLGDTDVLVRFHAAALNYRDLAIAQGKFPFGFEDNVVPGSDGAGEVVAVGPRVTRFNIGDRVATLFNQGHLAGSLDQRSVATGVGGTVDGFAKAVGARVIATTSTKEKEDRLKQLGADHVINYKEQANWGEIAKELTGGRGVDHVIEVGGLKTMAQSLKSIRIDGLITIVGFIGGDSEKQPSFLDVLSNICTVRGLLVGSRLQFEEMNRAVVAKDIHPVVDKQVYDLDHVPEAFQYIWEQRHFGKVVVSID
ncbi:Zinc-type alcohol dehydrogenase-like protein [Lasiodiplodia hormozganensis]|uniref:Zinc-type alcohol dehydrogenase-like protein n=1 Tax=Lasiodiplodia hormozganensis TaxID=869390 RepID=A0AA39Y7D0_9PEZI|nr:Zinc-type alcohol dehydrogenase-like protein [Lasiodiplodia hormozganensis]